MDTVLLKSVSGRIGHILKVFREKQGTYQSEIASKSGISTSMLSQIERGAVSPSIETLISVCSVLGIEVSELFNIVLSKEKVKITHSDKRLKSEREGISYEHLVSSNENSHPAEMFLLEIRPGSRTCLRGKSHEGVEMGLALEGSAVLNVDGDDYNIKKGDSVSFSARFPHRLINNSRKNFRAVWTLIPPHSDYFDIYDNSEGREMNGKDNNREDF